MSEEQHTDRLAILQQKWLNKSISKAELVELNRWYELKGDFTLNVPEEFATAESEIEERMLDRIKSSKKKPAPMGLSRWRWVGAASVILIAGAILYQQFFVRSTSNIVKLNPVSKEVKAGYDHAILKLGNGQTVVLDSTSDGNIQQQGSATVTKFEGVLSYKSTATEITNTVFNTMITPRGGQYKVILSDGSIVWLNSDSEIRFPTNFLGNERIVELRGEAFFDIAKKSSQPFRVKIAKLEVEVLGTTFNVDAYENEIKTTLINGSVNVKSIDNKKLKLQPGEQAKVLSNKLDEINLVANVDIDDVISWTKGIFQFRNADLNVIARQLSRWYDVDIETTGNVEKIELGGTISKKVSLDKILKVLEKNGVNHKWNKEKLILYAL